MSKRLIVELEKTETIRYVGTMLVEVPDEATDKDVREYVYANDDGLDVEWIEDGSEDDITHIDITPEVAEVDDDEEVDLTLTAEDFGAEVQNG